MVGLSRPLGFSVFQERGTLRMKLEFQLEGIEHFVSHRAIKYPGPQPHTSKNLVIHPQFYVNVNVFCAAFISQIEHQKVLKT